MPLNQVNADMPLAYAMLLTIDQSREAMCLILAPCCCVTEKESSE